MSKKSSQAPVLRVHGFSIKKFQRLVGQLLTVVDSIGLEEVQRKAVKDIINQHVWNLWESPTSSHDIENPIEYPTLKDAN